MCRGAGRCGGSSLAAWPHDPAALARAAAMWLRARRSRAGAHAPGSPVQFVPQRHRRIPPHKQERSGRQLIQDGDAELAQDDGSGRAACAGGHSRQVTFRKPSKPWGCPATRHGSTPLPLMRRNLVGPGQQRDLERSPHDDGRASRPARSDLNRAAINTPNEHGVPRRACLRNRLVGGGGRGWAGNQQACKVRAPRPAVCPCRRRQPWPIGCLA
jgi:hypothetical protein